MVGETVSRLRASFCAVIRAPLFPLNSRQRSSKIHKVRRSFFSPRPRPRASLWPPRNAQAQAGLCRRRGKRNQRERTRKRKQNYSSLFQLIAVEPCKKILLMRPCFCAREKRWLHARCMVHAERALAAMAISPYGAVTRTATTRSTCPCSRGRRWPETTAQDVASRGRRGDGRLRDLPHMASSTTAASYVALPSAALMHLMCRAARCSCPLLLRPSLPLLAGPAR